MNELPAEPLGVFHQVCKWYGPVIGVNDISVTLGAGITGLVGHNGAGKSTLIKLLTGQLRPSVGQVSVRGHEAWSWRAKRYLGYCPDVDAFYEEMSGRAFVEAMARLHGFRRHAARTRVAEVLHKVGMENRAERPLASYSKGMRQRIKLAQALVHDPHLIVLDEPLNGVDPVGRSELIAVFRTLRAEGKAILISSHLLGELDHLADRILFIGRGRLLAAGALVKVREMLDQYPMKVRITVRDARHVAARLMELPMIQGIQLQDEESLLAEVRRPDTFFAVLTQEIAEQGWDIERVQVMDSSTEAIFDYLMSSPFSAALQDRAENHA